VVDVEDEESSCREAVRASSNIVSSDARYIHLRQFIDSRLFRDQSHRVPKTLILFCRNFELNCTTLVDFDESLLLCVVVRVVHCDTTIISLTMYEMDVRS